MNMKIVLVRISLSVDCSTVTFSLLMSVLLRSIGYENIKLIIGRSLVNSYKVIIGVSSCLDVSTVEATLVSGFGRQRSLKVESMELEPRRSLNSVCKELLGVTSGEIVGYVAVGSKSSFIGAYAQDTGRSGLKAGCFG